jgi:hypothetical protein
MVFVWVLLVGFPRLTLHLCSQKRVHRVLKSSTEFIIAEKFRLWNQPITMYEYTL